MHGLSIIDADQQIDHPRARAGPRANEPERPPVKGGGRLMRWSYAPSVHALLLLMHLLNEPLASAAEPPHKLSIPAAAEGKVGKMQCTSGSISIVTAQYGV